MSMNSSITGYHKDAELACGHFQHVRHNPPWVSRPWVVTAEGRKSMLDHKLACKKCDLRAPVDTI